MPTSVPIFFSVRTLLRPVVFITAEEELKGEAIPEGRANVDEKQPGEWPKVG